MAGIKRNVQQQVEERVAHMAEVSRSFSEHPDRFQWLGQLLASESLSPSRGLLVAFRSVPDEGCWVHYGTWLTSDGRFLEFTADETYGDRLLEHLGRLGDYRIKDVTEQTSTDEFVRGIGSSFGWLALQALKASGKAD